MRTLTLVALCTFFGCNSESAPLLYVISTDIPADASECQDNSAKSSFEVVNDSDTKVNILQIQSSCKCAKVVLSSEVLPPHSRITADLVVDQSKSNQLATYSAVLRTDSPATPRLTLSSTPSPAVSQTNGHIEFNLGKFPPCASFSEIVSLSKSGMNDASLRVEQTEHLTGLKVNVLRDPRESYSMQLRITGQGPCQLGPFHEKVNLSASNYRWRSAELLLRGDVVLPWTVPNDVFLGLAPKSATIKRTLVVRNRFAKSAYLRSAPASLVLETNRPDIITTKVRLDGAGGYEIDIAASNDGHAGAFNASLHMVIDQGESIHFPFDIMLHALFE